VQPLLEAIRTASSAQELQRHIHAARSLTATVADASLHRAILEAEQRIARMMESKRARQASGMPEPAFAVVAAAHAAHAMPESDQVCKAYLQGRCHKGRSCKWGHPAKGEEAPMPRPASTVKLALLPDVPPAPPPPQPQAAAPQPPLQPQATPPSQGATEPPDVVPDGTMAMVALGACPATTRAAVWTSRLDAPEARGHELPGHCVPPSVLVTQQPVATECALPSSSIPSGVAANTHVGAAWPSGSATLEMQREDLDPVDD